MTVRIEITGQDADDILFQLRGFVGCITAEQSAGSKIIEGLKDAVAQANQEPPPPNTAAPGTVFVTSSGEEIATAPRRGRPRKNAQPAVAENTGSAPAQPLTPATPSASPEAEDASEPAAGAAQVVSPAPATITAEAVRAKLQEFLTTPGGDAGLQLASKVLAKFGLQKVKQVNDASPEVLAGIVAAVDAELKEVRK